MTTDTLTPRITALLATLTQAERRRLSLRIATALQAANAARLAAQQQPDGSPFSPRKPQPARYPAAQGKIRQALFARLRTEQHLRIRTATPGLAEVGFSARDERIARIHHYGLSDPVNPHLTIRYPIRQLLGITDADQAAIARTVMDHITGA